MGDPIVIIKSFGGYRRCFLKGKYYRIAFYYYRDDEGSLNFEGDPDQAAKFKSFEAANEVRVRIERLIDEPLHMARLSDARKILATQVIGEAAPAKEVKAPAEEVKPPDSEEIVL